MMRSTFGRAAAVACVAAAGISGASLAGVSAAATRPAASSNPYNLVTPGQLTVGMTLQFKPEMYLTASGQPAGYDVVLIKALAKSMGLKLKIDNLAFTGLIPGLVAKKFDVVSVGLSPTPAREKVISFSRAYVPYALILAESKTAMRPASIAAWNSPSVTLTALTGSTDAQLAQSTFPKAKLQTFGDDTTALLQVATGRAQGAVVEDYILAQFNKSNGNKLQEVPFKKPLNVQYGAYGVQKGNTALVKYLNSWLCKEQTSGALAKDYEQTEGVPTFPPMPACTM